MFETSSRSISERSVRMFFSTHLQVFYLENSFSSLDSRLILLSPCNLSWYLKGCNNYNVEWMSSKWMDRYVYRRIWLSFRYLSSLRFSSEDTDQHLITMVHVTHTALFTSSIPLFGGYHTYFLAEKFVQKLTLRTPSWSNHYSTSWSRWIYHLN